MSVASGHDGRWEQRVRAKGKMDECSARKWKW